MYEFEGLQRVPVTEAEAGRHHLPCPASATSPSAIRSARRPALSRSSFVKISAPTMEMTFSVNDGPFAGREGKFVTCRQIRERLLPRDAQGCVSACDRYSRARRIRSTSPAAARCRLSILIETMRREGYEFQVSPPRVLYQTINGQKCEPIERLVADVPDRCRRRRD